MFKGIKNVRILYKNKKSMMIFNNFSYFLEDKKTKNKMSHK